MKSSNISFSNHPTSQLVSGKVTPRNHGFSHEIWGFPVTFPIIPPFCPPLLRWRLAPLGRAEEAAPAHLNGQGPLGERAVRLRGLQSGAERDAVAKRGHEGVTGSALKICGKYGKQASSWLVYHGDFNML